MRFSVPVHLRWGDLDAYNHVNNVEMMRVLEEARVRTFWRPEDPAEGEGSPLAVIDAHPGATTNTLISRHEIEYLAPIPYLRDPLDVQLWLGRLGGASLDVNYEVFSPAGRAQTLFARASSTIVLVDATTGRPRRISDAERAAWEVYSEPPVEFRARRAAS